MTAKKPKVGLRDEPQPDAKALGIIERIEALGFREETPEEYAERLAAWRRRLEALRRKCRGGELRAADLDALGPEPDVDDLVPDPAVGHFDGMSLGEYASMLLELLPGRAHGYLLSAPPDRPTPLRHDRFPAGADDRPPLTDAYVRTLRRRV